MKPSILIILACLLAACHPSAPVTNGRSLFAYGNKRLLQYDAYIASLDTAKATSLPLAAQKFRVLFKGQPAPVCDTAYYIFEHLAGCIQNSLNTQMSNDKSTSYEVLALHEVNGHKPVIHAGLKDYVTQLKENGFAIAAEEDVPRVVFCRDFAPAYVYSYVSATMKQYLEQLNRENREGLDIDAELVVSPQQLAERAIWWERFCGERTLQSFIFSAGALHKKQEYRNLLLRGSDDTPLLEGETLAGYYRDAYRYISLHYPHTQTDSMLVLYTAALQRKDSAALKALN
ncbi:hypothetical protein [Deminuibacter soli]|uniref:Lipoprotein n=1 Tax=Deminuibacter soli TaxID=2291815 RepID=A0A3E1NQM6_9BACT|nr:hypothetical protein [Deminuibacter soli]RFM30124.1 hypothetical protein DXN05_03885 [Deminuibacter soli]